MNEPRRLTLRAATEPRDEALGAWRDLVDRFDLADLWDDEVYRLLPLVWHRLGDEVGPEHVDRLKGSYRKSWVTHQHLVRQGGEVVSALAERRIDGLVLGGAALGALAYEDPATRPTATLDLLVRPEQAVATWRLLDELGYRPRSAREPDDGWYLRVRHPRSFVRGTLDLVDVHTTLAPELVAADPEVADVSDLWDRAVDVDLGATAASTLSPTDHLFHLLLQPPALGRVVDARMLLDRTEVDEAELAATASRHRCGLLVSQRLDGRRMDVDPDRRERLAARLRERSPGAAQLVTSTRGLGPLATVGRTPDFLVDRWRLVNRRQLPRAMARRLRR